MRRLSSALTILCVFFASVARAEDLSLELTFDGEAPANALAIGGVYETSDTTCTDIIIDGASGRVAEAKSDPIEGTFDLVVTDLCILTLLNMDQDRGMVIRFAESMRNLALLNDQRWTTSGAQLASSGRRSFSLILSRRMAQTIAFKIQYEETQDAPSALLLNLTTGE